MTFFIYNFIPMVPEAFPFPYQTNVQALSSFYIFILNEDMYLNLLLLILTLISLGRVKCMGIHGR